MACCFGVMYLSDCQCKYFDDRSIKIGMYFEKASQDALLVSFCLLLVLSGAQVISTVSGVVYV